MESQNKNGLIYALIFSIIAFIVSIGTAISVRTNIMDDIKDAINPDKVESVQTTDTTTYTEPVTIDDILQFRKDIKEQSRYDSIFMNMPDVALIAILMKRGTEMSNSDIAKEYLQNRKDYDNVEFGAQINDTYKQNKITPDSIPQLLIIIALVRENRCNCLNECLQKMTNLWGVSNKESERLQIRVCTYWQYAYQNNLL